MARRHDTTPETCDKARLRWLQKQLRDVRKDREKASEDGSHSAVAALRREERNLRDLVDAGRLEIARRDARANRKEMTPEERAQELRERIDNAATEELEVAVEEWLRRVRYEMRKDETGRLLLVPQGEHRPELRLVSER